MDYVVNRAAFKPADECPFCGFDKSNGEHGILQPALRLIDASIVCRVSIVTQNPRRLGVVSCIS